MNYIFFILIAVSIVVGTLNNSLQDLNNAMLQACDLSVKIAFSLIGIMTFWLGMMRIAEKSGLTSLIAKLLKPFANLLFKDVSNNSNVIGDIAMSVSANALGLTNAATPIGLKVMDELQQENKTKDSATDAMCMFLAMNTAGFQIIPATVIAVLVGLGAKNPTEIILPTLIVTTLSFLFAIAIALVLKRIWNKQEGKSC